jgi:hypothetical protein
MAGGGSQRYCARCERNVHDLSAMSADAAMSVLCGPDERLCVRFNARADGSVVFGGPSRLRRVLRVAGLLALGAWFWATVVLVQLPWLALTRRVSPPPTSPREQQAQQERDRKELELKARAAVERERLMGAIKGEEARAMVMGGMPKGDRHRAIREYERKRHHHQKKTP